MNALEKQINDDCNQGRTPILVVAYAGETGMRAVILNYYPLLPLGTPLSGQIEPIQLLRGVCNRYNMWLHVTG